MWERSQEQRSSRHCLGNTAPSQSAGIHFACKGECGNSYENTNRNPMQENTNTKKLAETIINNPETKSKENFPKPLKCHLDSLVAPETHQHLLELDK